VRCDSSWFYTHSGTGTEMAVDGDPAAQSGDAVLQSAESRATGRVGAANAVVCHGDAKVVLRHLHLHAHDQRVPCFPAFVSASAMTL
jgi:hypothetical protein